LILVKRVLLIIGGGIAAYKCLDLIRRLKERGLGVRAVLTRAAQEFVTPLSVGALTNDRVFTDLFDLDDEREIGHIRLSREADLIVVAPATADLLARMAQGQANDLATAVLLATDKPVLAAPAMNPRMWGHPATRRNVKQLEADGIQFIGPEAGEMAERGEAGVGRLAEVPQLVERIESMLEAAARASAPNSSKSRATQKPLSGRHVLVTSGPTHEAIDPVRFIGNRSSGKQGHAIAIAAAALGARVSLITGPVSLPDPAGVEVRHVVTAQEMLEAVQQTIPADIAIFAAAVADWRVASPVTGKIKKRAGMSGPKLELVENPDILKAIAKRGPSRPALVIGFAAETDAVIEHAIEKRKTKGADWIVANDVSAARGVFGGDANSVHLVTVAGVESWPPMSKVDVAEALMMRAAQHLLSSQIAV
jgi:phosphopantothenoylcysteine decarboxylase/phosphopantothenate--cysteine ligase